MWTFAPLLLLLAVVGTANAFVAFPIHTATTSALRYHFADRDGDALTTGTGGAKDTAAINGASGYMKMKKSVTPGGMASPRVSKTKANLFFADGADDEDDEKTTSVATADKEGTSSMAETVVIDPDFRVAAFFLAIGLVLDQIPFIQLTLGPLVTALGVLFLVQTFRLRFVFEAGNFELKTVSDFGLGSLLGGGGDDNNNSNDSSGSLQEAGENVVVGGTNRWATSSIFNYDFFPQGWMEDENHPVGPILVYFKEDQTPSETWNEGPGKIANDPAKIEAGIARAGQVHFFPTVANAQQLRDEFAKRGCKKI